MPDVVTKRLISLPEKENIETNDYIITDNESVGTRKIKAEKFKADTDAILSTIAPPYESSSTYSKGDYVTHDEKLYKAKQDISTAEAWTSAHWDEAQVSDIIEYIENNTELQTITTILEYENPIIAEIEQYSINASTGKNTTSSYSKYYRTGGFYQPTHIKATSTRGELKTTIYFYADADADTFISATEATSNLDSDVAYPTGANYVRVAGYINTNPDDPLDLTAVTVEMTLDPAKAQSVVKDLKSSVQKITALFTDADVENTASYSVNTDVPYNLVPSDITWTPNKQVKTDDGSLVDSTDKYASDYIAIDSSKQYLQHHIAVIHKVYNPGTGNWTAETVSPFIDYQYAFYDENKVFVASSSESTDYVKVIPSTAKYIRVSVDNANKIPYARLIYANSVNNNVVTVGNIPFRKTPKLNYIMPNTGFENFKMVCFGDSITHGDLTGNNDGFSYVDYASYALNATLYNVGFGSSTSAQVAETPTNVGLFAFWNLANCITSNDSNTWNDLDSYAANSNTTFIPHLERLKAIDWSTINAISLLYGANDWAQNVPVGESYSENTFTYDGAIAYGIKKLLTSYPHLQVMILSPFYRNRAVDNIDASSDTENTAGVNMSGYADSLKNVQNGLHVTVIDSGNWNFNNLTINTLTSDGTHPRSDIGQKRLGNLFAQAIKTNLSPI